MSRVNDINAIPTVQEILLQNRYPKMSGYQPTCHVCCAMLTKLDMIFTSYSKLLVKLYVKVVIRNSLDMGCV